MEKTSVDLNGVTYRWPSRPVAVIGGPGRRERFSALGEPAPARVSRYHDHFIRSEAGPVFRADSCRIPKKVKISFHPGTFKQG